MPSHKTKPLREDHGKRTTEAVRRAAPTEAAPTDSAAALVHLFRECARQLRRALWLLNGRPGADPDVLAAEQREDEERERELRRRYPDAIFRTREFEERARQHGIKFCPLAQPHHRAAILEFLDNPGAPKLLSSMHATWFQAIDADGRFDGSMAHPVNQAQFQITYLYAQSHGWQTNYWTSERAQWSVAQWLDHEQEQRAIMAAASARALATGRDQRLPPFDHIPPQRAEPAHPRSTPSGYNR